MARDGARTSALDLDLLALQTLGDRELEAELFLLFESQAERLLPIIGGQGDRLARCEAAHSLKGASAAVGAVEVMRLAGELEIGLAQDGSNPASTVSLLENALRDAREAIENWRRAG